MIGALGIVITKKDYEAGSHQKIIDQLQRAGIGIQYDLHSRECLEAFSDDSDEWENIDTDNAPDCCPMLLVPDDFQYGEAEAEAISRDYGCIDERYDFRFDVVGDVLVINPRYYDPDARFNVDMSKEGWDTWLAQQLVDWAKTGEWSERNET